MVVRPTVPLELYTRILDQPTFSRSAGQDELVKRRRGLNFQRNFNDLLQADLDKQRREAEEARAREAQLRAQQAKELEQKLYRQLVQSFSPETPGVLFTQAVASRGEKPIAQMVEEARTAEGEANLLAFGRLTDTLSREEKVAYGPMIAALQKEQVGGRDVLRVIMAFKDDPNSIYDFPPELREKTNRILAALTPLGSGGGLGGRLSIPTGSPPVQGPPVPPDFQPPYTGPTIQAAPADFDVEEFRKTALTRKDIEKPSFSLSKAYDALEGTVEQFVIGGARIAVGNAKGWKNIAAGFDEQQNFAREISDIFESSFNWNPTASHMISQIFLPTNWIPIVGLSGKTGTLTVQALAKVGVTGTFRSKAIALGEMAPPSRLATLTGGLLKRAIQLAPLVWQEERSYMEEFEGRTPSAMEQALAATFGGLLVAGGMMGLPVVASFAVRTVRNKLARIRGIDLDVERFAKELWEEVTEVAEDGKSLVLKEGILTGEDVTKAGDLVGRVDVQGAPTIRVREGLENVIPPSKELTEEGIEASRLDPTGEIIEKIDKAEPEALVSDLPSVRAPSEEALEAARPGVVPEPARVPGEQRVVTDTGNRPKVGDLVARSHTPNVVFGKAVKATPDGITIEERGTGKRHFFPWTTKGGGKIRSQLIPVEEIVQRAGEELPPVTAPTQLGFSDVIDSLEPAVTGRQVMDQLRESTPPPKGPITTDEVVADATRAVDRQAAGWGLDDLGAYNSLPSDTLPIHIPDDMVASLRFDKETNLWSVNFKTGKPSTDDISLLSLEEVTSKQLKRFGAYVGRNYKEHMYVSKSLAAMVRSEVDGRAHKLFTLGKDEQLGFIINKGFRGKSPDAPLHWIDVFENPDNYVWHSQEARDFADWYVQTVGHKTEEGLKAGIFSGQIDPDIRFVPRAVVRFQGENMRIGVMGRSIGAKASFDSPRTREFIVQDEDLVYLSDFGANIEHYLMQIDHRIASNQVNDSFGNFARTTTDNLPKDVKKAVTSGESKVKSLRSKIATAEKNARGNKTAATALRGQRDTLRKERLSAKADEFQDRADILKELEVAQDVLKRARTDKANLKDTLGQGKPGKGETILHERFATQKIFPKEFESLERTLRAPQGIGIGGIRLFAEGSAILKPLQASLDLSFMALQTAMAFVTNPIGTLQAWEIAGRSLFDPQIYNRFIVQNRAVIEEMITLAKVPFYATEFTMKGVREELFPERGPIQVGVDRFRNWAKNHEVELPGLGTVSPSSALYPFERYGRAVMNTNEMWSRSLNVASINLYKQHKALLRGVGQKRFTTALKQAFGPGIVGKEGGEIGIGRTIAHMTGRLTTTEQASQGPVSQLLLRASLFAGNYWIAHGKLLSTLIKGGMEGNLARRAVAGWLFMAFTSIATINELTGQPMNIDPRDVLEDPTKASKFLTTKIGGVTIGPGGPLQQTIAFGLKMISDPDSTGDNLALFLKGKASPSISYMVDVGPAFAGLLPRSSAKGSTFTGRVISGPMDILRESAARFLPFAAQDVALEISEGNIEGAKEELKSAPGTITGLRSFPEGPFEKRNQYAKETFGREWQDLLPTQKKQFEDENPGLVEQIRTRQSERDEQKGLLFERAREDSERTVEKVAELESLFLSGDIDGRELREGIDTALLVDRSWREITTDLLTSVGLPERERPEGVEDAADQTLQDIFDYFLIFDQFPGADTNPDTKDRMFDALAKFRSDMGEGREASLDAQLGLRFTDSPLYQELKRDRVLITESGWWDLGDVAWAKTMDWARGRGQIISISPDEYFESLLTDLLSTYGPLEARLKLERDQILRIFNRFKERERKTWARSNSGILPLLDRWDYRSFTQSELRLGAREERRGPEFVPALTS